MSVEMSIVERANIAPCLGTRIVAPLLAKVAQYDMLQTLAEPAVYDELELDAAEADEHEYTVRLWQRLDSDQAPAARRLSYEFMFGIETTGIDSKLMDDKKIVTDGEIAFKLTQPQALLFAGLSFRARMVRPANS